jgi:hypothetical protein
MDNIEDVIIPTNEELEKLDAGVYAAINQRLCDHIIREAAETTDDIARYALARLTTYRAGCRLGDVLHELELIAVLPRPVT